NTDGTRDLASRWAPERLLNEETTRKRMESLKSPERAAKIGAAKRGIPTPDHVKEAIARAKTGSKATQQTRLKMSEAHKRRGTTRSPGSVVIRRQRSTTFVDVWTT